jgi:hypothetical protein
LRLLILASNSPQVEDKIERRSYSGGAQDDPGVESNLYANSLRSVSFAASWM